jgi:DNA-binding NarL/FixJ family response regulator
MLEATGQACAARRLRARALARLRTPAFAHTLLDEIVARDQEDRAAAARAVLQQGSDDDRVTAAHLLLADARLAARRNQSDAARTHARRAAQGFRALDRPYEEAQSLELAGCRHDALVLYRRIGAASDCQRLADPRQWSRADQPPRLTRRERDVAMLVAEGLRNQAIAERLVISRRTVEAHLAAIYDRLGVQSRTELTARIIGAHRWTGDGLAPSA